LDSLRQSQLISQLAGRLYPWLPGSAYPRAKTFTFHDAAAEVGLGSSWIGGSKLPAIESLIESAYKRAQLRSLVLVVVREGVKYRGRRGPEVSAEEVGAIADILEALGVRVPELIATGFVSALPRTPRASNQQPVLLLNPVRLSALHERFLQIESNPDPQGRGYELQDVLFGLFELFGLRPRPPFRVSGEEIDGSFELAGETYLLEARWRKKESTKADLIAFQEKVVSKSGFSRGLFVSMGPFTAGALGEFSIGRVPRIVIASKKETEAVLRGTVRLDSLIASKVRLLSETGKFSVDA
jgi:hypothetical protein